MNFNYGNTMKKIVSAKAAGYGILVEMLSQQEAMNTTLSLTKEESTQGYVKDVGPLVDKKCGLKKGDRVLLQGNYVPVPHTSKAGRKLGVVDLHNIKAVLGEDEDKE